MTVHGEVVTAQSQSPSPKVQQPVIIQQHQPFEVQIPPTPLINQIALYVLPILAAFISAVSAWLLANKNYNRQLEDQRREQKRANTLQMSEEFNNESMWSSRAEADKRFVPRDSNVPRDIRQDYQNMNISELAPIFRVIYFYKRLDILHEEKRIDENLAKELFSENYTWWFDKYISHQIKNLQNDPSDKWKDVIVKYDWLYKDSGREIER